MSHLQFTPKFFSIIKNGISKEQIIHDIFAGVIVGIVAFPLAIAFGIASGATPQQGLITAVIAGFIISAFGGSRVPGRTPSPPPGKREQLKRAQSGSWIR